MRLAAIRDMRGGYGKMGFLENIFRRKKIITHLTQRVDKIGNKSYRWNYQN